VIEFALSFVLVVHARCHVAQLSRFSVSIESELLRKFDNFVKEKSYPNRSFAFRELIRTSLVTEEWSQQDEVAGVIALAYNHHKRELVTNLTKIQHKFRHLILSTQHIHLDHDNCLEVIVVKGKPGEAQELCDMLKATKGVKHGTLSMATTGRRIP
jgi:CopG family nickel-responsive transcriptional regulator